MKENGNKLPPVGMRIIKSSVAVLLCFIIYELRGRTGIPFYSALAALWCMRPNVSNSREMAIQRTIGTFIGAAFGFVVLFCELYVFHIHDAIAGYMIAAVMLIPILYTTVLINKKNASYFSCVVFLSITVTHLYDANPFMFVANRVIDTMLGIIIGLAVNVARIPRKKRDDILFVSGLDDTLLTMNENMTSYSKIELNRMLDEGAKFVISTVRTPASLMKPLSDIHINLPVIAMDGAVLYDVKENEYIHAYVISYDTVMEIYSFLKERGITCFTNVVVDDLLMIYYDEFNNEFQQKLFTEMKKSPYRNYVKREISKDCQTVIYLLLMDTKERILNLYNELVERGYSKRLRIYYYEDKNYPGSYCIKIYNKNATKENMMEYLKQMVNASEIITFGSIEGRYDVIIGENDNNKVVRTLKRIYEPYFFEK